MIIYIIPYLDLNNATVILVYDLYHIYLHLSLSALLALH